MSNAQIGDMVRRKANQRIPEWPDNEPRKLLTISKTDFGATVEGVCLSNGTLYSHTISYLEVVTVAANPWENQVGGAHYKDKTIQPLQYTLAVKGYVGFDGACHNHVARYTSRVKDNQVVQLKKARHILDLWIYEAEKEESKNDRS